MLAHDWVLPALEKIRSMVVVTARDREKHVASRFSVPCHVVHAVPAIGSTDAALVPYWITKLGRTAFTALDARARVVALHGRLVGDGAQLGGRHLARTVEQLQL
ncbi:MAG TPA: hypothetical protein VGU01_14595 [Sphingomicrobium sp.]|nr:hypothetical protein [Sphingomicrobium sp.]